MDKAPVYFDPETVTLLKETLDDAWACLRPEQQATMLKTALAERILKSAASASVEARPVDRAWTTTSWPSSRSDRAAARRRLTSRANLIILMKINQVVVNMPDATEVNKGHFETNWGGRREGAGRPPGAVTVNRYSKGPVLASLRREWRETHAADTMAALRELIDQKEDGWLRLAAIKEMMDRLWGKASQHITMDADSTIAAVYETLDEVRQDLIDSGLPLDHLEAPRLFRTVDVEPNKEPNK